MGVWIQGQGLLPFVPATPGAVGTGIVLLARDEGKGAFLGMGRGRGAWEGEEEQCAMHLEESCIWTSLSLGEGGSSLTGGGLWAKWLLAGGSSRQQRNPARQPRDLLSRWFYPVLWARRLQ